MFVHDFCGLYRGGIPGAALATCFVFCRRLCSCSAAVHYIEKVRETEHFKHSSLVSAPRW